MTYSGTGGPYQQNSVPGRDIGTNALTPFGRGRCSPRSESTGMALAPDPEDIAALDRLRELCSRLSAADEATLQGRPLFRVGRRRFALFNGASSPPRQRWNGAGRSLHFLAAPDELPALRQDARFTASPHHGDRGWLAVRLDADVIEWDEVGELLESAYRQVLPRSEAQ